MSKEIGYEAPNVEDFGSLAELTAAGDIFGPEDGGNKLLGIGFVS